MESPKDRYKTLMNIRDINKVAYDTLFTKYIVENRRGEEKLWEWDSTDQESLVRAKNGGYPLPGSIYTFIYPPKDAQGRIVDRGQTHDYVDVVPLIFCTGYKNTNITGINFNLLPKQERLNFLEVYYQGYRKFFKDLEEKTQNDILALNKKFISIASSPIGSLILDAFIKRTGSNFKFAYRQYKMSNIDNLRMVEYCEWNYIPFYEPRNALKGMNFKQIYDLYWRS